MTAYYFGGAYEVTGSDVKKYYNFGGQSILRDSTGLQYFLTDHLGSVVAITDDEGTLTSQQRYLPFGGIRTNIGSITQTDFGYTGQRQLDMGLMDYKARFFSTSLGRFIQPDTLIPDPTNPQAWNRFSYVGNRPVNFNDPSGHRPCGDGYAVDCDGFQNHLGGNGGGGGGGGSGGGGGGGEGDPEDEEEEEKEESHQCTNIQGQHGGCIHYFSVAIGLDAPTLMMISGLGLSFVGLPQYGLPVALAGVVIEQCAFTATPQCAIIKLLSVNVSGTIDEYGNLYIGPQISWGKSILPFIAVSDYIGTISSGNNPHVPTEAEVKDTLSGLSFSAGTIATGGVSYSPLATTYKTSYYIDGFPEVFSVNINFNFPVYDFSP